MTPKDKAKELVYKYENLVTTWDCYWDTEIPVENRLPEMKQCALITVDDILDAICFNMCDEDEWNKENEFWKEVKEEIEKL
jgi:hypothetical protein